MHASEHRDLVEKMHCLLEICDNLSFVINVIQFNSQHLIFFDLLQFNTDCIHMMANALRFYDTENLSTSQEGKVSDSKYKKEVP